MKIKYLYIMVVLLGVLSACNKEEWDKHYSAPEGSELNVVQVLEGLPQYSDYLSLIKASGYDSLLVEEGFFSVFAPTNDALAQMPLEQDDVDKLIEFSVIEKNLFSYNLSDSIIHTTIGGKLGLIRVSNDQQISLDEALVIENDISCANGLIHGVDKVRIPVDNIYEHILNDASYTTLQQLINSYEVKIFDKSNSTEIGINEIGDIVYDSAFIYVNSLLSKTIDISKENKLSTAFLISDVDLALAVERDLGAYLGDNREFDILRETYYHMFLDQIIKDASYSYDEIPLLFTTAAGNTRSIDKETIITRDIELSNGHAHVINDVELPLTEILKSVTIEGEQAHNRTLSVQDGQTSAVYDKKLSGDYWFRFNKFPKDNGWIEYKVENLYQTTYTVSYGSSGKYPNQLRMMVDGQQLGESFSSATSHDIGDIEFTDFGDHTFRLEYVGDSEEGEINLDYIKLVPHLK